MSDLFAALVEIVQAGIFTVAQGLGGSLPAAIIVVTCALRIALLPLTYRLALRARAHGRRLKELAPEIKGLRAKFTEDPQGLSRATMALYQERGVQPFDGAVLGGTLAQAPIFAAFFQAVRGLVPALSGQRFLWIRDLAAPSALLGVVAAAFVLISTLLGSSSGAQPAGWVRALPAAMTLGMLLFFSSAFGLYMLASSGIGVLQAVLVHRAEARIE